MGFSFVSELPACHTEEFKAVTSFQYDVDAIKRYLTEIGNNYLLIAYRVYEMSWTENYKPFYKNIAEACYTALGFKKSTTYNLLNIVKRFGTPDDSGFIPFNSLFGCNKFSYSQLTEMLSMSDKQIEQIKPEMTVKEIKLIKKESTLEASGAPDSEPIAVIDSEIGEQVVFAEFFQTSGNDEPTDVNKIELFDDDLICCPRCGSSCKTGLNAVCETYVICKSCKLHSPAFLSRSDAFAYWNISWVLASNFAK